MPRISYGTQYTVKISGSTWKPVVCENCGSTYLYKVSHQTSGSATDFLWLNKLGTQIKAKENAENNLHAYLSKAVRNYSCPQCGFYQSDMIKRMKNDILLKAIVFGFITGFLVTALSNNIVYGFILGGIVCSVFLFKLLGFSPNANALDRRNREFSENYPVLLVSEVNRVLPTEQGLFCNKCGCKGLPTDRYCRNCGQKMM